MPYIYMNLGFVFQFGFFYQKQMISILQVLETILWNFWNICSCSESDDFINCLGCKRVKDKFKVLSQDFMFLSFLNWTML